jgi:hypothetical protein
MCFFNVSSVTLPLVAQKVAARPKLPTPELTIHDPKVAHQPI